MKGAGSGFSIMAWIITDYRDWEGCFSHIATANQAEHFQ